MIDPDTNTLPRQMRRHRRQRRWIWVKRVALILVLHFAIATLGFAIDWKLTRDAGEEQLAIHTARLDAEDPGWRFVDIVAEHNSKVPPPESNTAMMAVAVIRTMPNSSFAASMRAEIDRGRLPNELPKPARWESLNSMFTGWEPSAEALREFDASTPRGRFAIEYTGGDPLGIKIDNTQLVRKIAFVLDWDAMRSAHAGRPDPALRSALSMLHFNRSMDYEPTSITYLVRLATSSVALHSMEQTLAWCRTPSEEVLAAAQELLARESGHSSMHAAQRGDRAMILHAIDLFDRGEIRLDENKSSAWELGAIFYKQYLPTNSVFALERHAEFETMLKLPPTEKAKALRVWTMPPIEVENAMGIVLLGAINKVALAEIRYQAKCACTAAGIACERYRLKHGRWPASLDDLADFGLGKGLIDPFDGQPMRYSIVEDGVVIYSIGTDGRDDGGDVVRREGTPTDTGFRLWNEDKRRIERVEPAD